MTSAERERLKVALSHGEGEVDLTLIVGDRITRIAVPPRFAIRFLDMLEERERAGERSAH